MINYDRDSEPVRLDQDIPPIQVQPAETERYVINAILEAQKALKAIPPWHEVELQPDKTLFRALNAAKEKFWLRYGVAFGILHATMAFRKLSDENYRNMRKKLHLLLLSAKIRF